jgi:lipopolysaccharide/colanic/teichoic acid biosynthesis glycosyltransferase
LYSEPDWALRCSVRPGITGLAQAKLRSAATWDQRLALDLQYVREAGLWLDLKIMAWTLGLLTGRNAN